jgi:hypothetical protein
MATDTVPSVRKVVVVTPVLDRGGTTGNLAVALVAAVVSVVAHVILFLLMMSISVNNADAGASAEDVEGETKIEEQQKEEPDLTNVDLGNDSSIQTNFEVKRLDEISVPGTVDPTASVGIDKAP